MRTFARINSWFLNWQRGLLVLAVLGILSVVISSSLRSPAMAAYSSPAAGSIEIRTGFDESALFKAQLKSLGNAHEIPEEVANRVLDDFDGRISDEFSVPAEIRNSVEFWFKIYAQYSSDNIVLFDENHPEIIYEVLDFHELAATARNRIVYEVVANRTVEKKIAAYKAAFRRLSRNPRPKNPSKEESLILEAARKLPHRHSFSDLAETFRSQTGQRNFVINGLATAEDYMPKMEQVFAGFSLPKELVRLSLVESSFNVGVTSRVGAAGVWQFMRNSAQEYLLVHDQRRIDERLSPLKSTVAAAKLLKRNRRILGNWALAITSYNHGMRSLKKIAARAKDDFKSVGHVFRTCSKQRHGVGWASRNYYAEFVAMVHAEAYRDVLYSDLRKPTFKSLTFAELKQSISLATFSMNQGYPLREMLDLNPDVRDFSIALPVGFILTVPSEKDDLDLLIRRSRFIDPPKLEGRSLTGGFALAEKARKKRIRR